MATQQNAGGPDERTNREVMIQYRKLQDLKRGLIREGIVDGNASAQQVLQAVRTQVPDGLF